MKIPSVLEAEEEVVNLFHGKPTQTLTLPYYFLLFLLKASVLSPPAQREVLFHPFLLCQQVLLSSRNTDFSGNGHFTQTARSYWKEILCIVWGAVGKMGC